MCCCDGGVALFGGAQNSGIHDCIMLVGNKIDLEAAARPPSRLASLPAAATPSLASGSGRPTGHSRCGCVGGQFDSGCRVVGVAAGRCQAADKSGFVSKNDHETFCTRNGLLSMRTSSLQGTPTATPRGSLTAAPSVAPSVAAVACIMA